MISDIGEQALLLAMKLIPKITLIDGYNASIILKCLCIPIILKNYASIIYLPLLSMLSELISVTSYILH